MRCSTSNLALLAAQKPRKLCRGACADVMGKGTSVVTLFLYSEIVVSRECAESIQTQIAVVGGM